MKNLKINCIEVDGEHHLSFHGDSYIIATIVSTLRSAICDGCEKIFEMIGKKEATMDEIKLALRNATEENQKVSHILAAESLFSGHEILDRLNEIRMDIYNKFGEK